MEMHKAKIDELRGMSPEQRRDTTDDVRKELANMRMDIYTVGAQNKARRRGLKKTLARLLTIQSDAKGPKPDCKSIR